MDWLVAVAWAFVVSSLLLTMLSFRGNDRERTSERSGWRSESVQILGRPAPAPLRPSRSSASEEPIDEPHLPHYQLDASSPVAGVVAQVVSATTSGSPTGYVRVFSVPADKGAFLPAPHFIVRVPGVTPTA